MSRYLGFIDDGIDGALYIPFLELCNFINWWFGIATALYKFDIF